ncbi:MAG: hypothetical protein K8I03_05615 [Ignavibacteria bacterium]|nr:hypothetical protein [Ignavibacteria bacterium]
MQTKIFVNLPVKDLNKSIEFYKMLGYTLNLQYTGEHAACFVISETIYIMLLLNNYFKDYTTKPVADASKTTEVINCLSAANRDHVNEQVDKALEAGATVSKEPIDFEFMYGRSFNNPDDHIWEIMWVDENHGEKKS